MTEITRGATPTAAQPKPTSILHHCLMTIGSLVFVILCYLLRETCIPAIFDSRKLSLLELVCVTIGILLPSVTLGSFALYSFLGMKWKEKQANEPPIEHEANE